METQVVENIGSYNKSIATPKTNLLAQPINKQNARQLAMLAVKVRKANALERNRLAEIGKQAIALPEPEPEDKFPEQTTNLARRQIKRLFALLSQETDPASMDRLAAAIAKLEEVERKVSGRFNPGTTRPEAPKKPRRSTQVEPIADDAPQPVVVPMQSNG